MVKESCSFKGMKHLKSLILLCLMVVFLGYIFIWFMMPTNTFYLHWLPQIHEKTDSTYFGQQGANILLYIFPILFIASLSGFYLHIRDKVSDSNTESVFNNAYIKSWKRPVLVKGPLGIISWTELSFFVMFVALLIWSFCVYLHGMFANINQQAAQMREPVWKAKLESVGLMLGLVGNICLAFLFFPVTRGSSILQLIGLTSESSIKYHIWLGHIAMTLFTAHGLAYIIFWVETDQISQMLKWDRVGVSNVAGELALLCGLVMWATSFPSIRRKIFELFFYTHHLYVVFLVFFVFHVGFSASCIMIPGFYLFLIDRCLRFLQSQQRIRLITARVLPCQTVELNFSKCPDLSYSPRSIVFLNVPAISKLQWHPFTITSSSNMDPEKLSVVVKSEGSWSSALYDKLSSTRDIDRVEISLEGPYGPPSTSFLRHKMLVLVSGGSGITPFISIVRELIFRANKGTENTPNVLLICAFKKSVDLSMLSLILPISGTNCDISHLPLRIEAYVTRENQSSEKHKTLQTLWLEPDPLETPVSAVLGKNTWFWLFVIVSVSFVLFLLLTGVITRYYITYATSHNSDLALSVSYKSALSMSFMCVSIATASSLAFLWNKRHCSNKMKQNQNSNTSRKINGSFKGNQTELESLPCQSLVEATNVHYGSRPDLKRIILYECKDSSVGIFVSGPRKMRQKVAAICSSPLENNLHFESSSFSW